MPTRYLAVNPEVCSTARIVTGPSTIVCLGPMLQYLPEKFNRRTASLADSFPKVRLRVYLTYQVQVLNPTSYPLPKNKLWLEKK